MPTEWFAPCPRRTRKPIANTAESPPPCSKKHGALSVVEAWGDDVPEGETNSMHAAVMRKNDETVVFSWVVWPSRTVRNEGVKNAMADPAMQADAMPFDGQRMIYGGFEVILKT